MWLENQCLYLAHVKKPIRYPGEDAKLELDKRRQKAVEWSRLWK